MMNFVVEFTGMYTIKEISDIIHADKVSFSDDSRQVKELVYDTRKVSAAKNAVFFAFVGQRNGHTYIEEAYGKGVRNFVVSDDTVQYEGYPEANFIFVEDTLKAIQELAAYYRKKFNRPVIGITGSNGKTIVKEWLYELLSEDRKVYQSPKSYNSQLGVALSLWDLSSEYDLAIIEAGISQPGEMDSLEQMIRPNIGVFTNLGVAHADGFQSKEQKLQEKLKLFRDSDVVIISSKYADEVSDITKKVISIGDQAQDVCCVLSVNHSLNYTVVDMQIEGVPLLLEIPFTDSASVENCITCVAVLYYLDYSREAIVQKIRSLKPVEMRLQLKSGINNTSIVDDSYSNDLGSLKIALDFLDQQKQHEKKTVILSEFAGVPQDHKYITKLIDLLSSHKIDRLIWVGESIEGLNSLDSQVDAYKDIKELQQKWSQLVFSNESILVKGSRKYHFENLVQKLTSKKHGTVLQINLNAISHNLNIYKSFLPDHVKLMVMVKAFSYGSGSFEVANLLQFHRVDYLTVAYVDEGVELRQGGITLPIMVMSPEESAFDSLVAYDLEPEIYNFSILDSFQKYLKERDIYDYPIHIKVDTGMHRLGFSLEEMSDVVLKLKSNNNLKIRSLFSHLVASGDLSQADFTRLQIERFTVASQKMEQGINSPFLRHLANTSAIVHWPEAHFDMVRLGIGLYGVDLSDRHLDLLPTSILKTTVTQIKKLKSGDTVGYDRKGVLLRDSEIATVKIGYADGYNRRFGNGVGTMQVGESQVPTVGNICMDMCMLDVTGLDVSEGDEVIVFPDIQREAAKIGAIPYELLVNVSARVKRVYYME